MVQIHPSSVIVRGASLGEGVRVGPFCIVGPDVVLGDGCELVSHAVIAGRTTMAPARRYSPLHQLVISHRI